MTHSNFSSKPKYVVKHFIYTENTEGTERACQGKLLHLPLQ